MELTAEKRQLKGKDQKPNTLRRAGVLPAVIYGRSEESTPISVNAKEFGKIFKAAGASTVVVLKGLDEDKQVLIQQVDVNPLTGAPTHADFYAIEKGQKVTVSVPLEFDGTAPAVKDLGGILIKVIHELEVECEPKDLPHAIHVDISKLTALDSKILVSDLGLSAAVVVSIPMDEVVAMIDTVTDEDLNTETAPVDLSAIETSVERGKKEDEAATGDAAAE